MKAKKHRLTLRTALATLLTLSLLVATAAFFGANAATPNELGEPKIVITASSLTFTVSGEKLYVDWGNGNLVAISSNDQVSGVATNNQVKIYGENITGFDCADSPATAIDVSNAKDLAELDCSRNHLTTLDLSKNTKLWRLECSGNRLTSLILPDSKVLYSVYCYKNQLTSLDVSKNTALECFSCGKNQLTALDVSNNTALKILRTYDNQLTQLDVSNNTALEIFSCDGNQLKYSTFNFGNAQLENFCYSPQQEVSIPATIESGKTIDLSSEHNINDILTVYTWKDSEGNTVTPTSSTNGVFTFGNDFVGKTLTCEMTNEKFPKLTLKTTSVTVEASTDPTTDPTDPATDPTDPATDPTDPTTDPTDPATDPTDPVTDPTQPTTEPTTQPATSPTTAPTQANELEDSDVAVEGESGFVDDAETLDKDGKPVQLQGVKLIVGNIETNKKKTVLDAIAHYNETFDADSDNVALYDISLVDNNKAHVTLTDGNKVRVCLKYPDNLGRQSEQYTFHLYHQKADGSLEEIAIDCKPNGIWFETDSFSPYALVWSEAAEITSDSPNTGEANTAASVACALALASALCAGAVICRRKIAA